MHEREQHCLYGGVRKRHFCPVVGCEWSEQCCKRGFTRRCHLIKHFKSHVFGFHCLQVCSLAIKSNDVETSGVIIEQLRDLVRVVEGNCNIS